MTGREVRALRSAMGLSVADFAALLGLHPSTVYQWQRPQHLPAAIDLDRLRTAILDVIRRAVEREQDLDLLGAEVRAALHVDGTARALHRLFVLTFGDAA
jgi:transcriptional regulator with XRE-family HTH domain